MPVIYKKTVACLEGECAVEEAEALFEWLRARPKARVNLRHLGHPHSAVLQVLMATRPVVSVAPDDPALAAWLPDAIAPTH